MLNENEQQPQTPPANPEQLSSVFPLVEKSDLPPTLAEFVDRYLYLSLTTAILYYFQHSSTTARTLTNSCSQSFYEY